MTVGVQVGAGAGMTGAGVSSLQDANAVNRKKAIRIGEIARNDRMTSFSPQWKYLKCGLMMYITMMMGITPPMSMPQTAAWAREKMRKDSTTMARLEMM